jgi:outer membrane receptor protein involved in Fe transport
MVHIFDPLEQGDTTFRGIEFVSDHRQTRWLNFSAQNTRTGIRKAFEFQKDKLELLGRSFGIPYTMLSCGTPLLKQLSGKF